MAASPRLQTDEEEVLTANRTFYAALQAASQDSGALAAGVIATVLASNLDAEYRLSMTARH